VRDRVKETIALFAVLKKLALNSKAKRSFVKIRSSYTVKKFFIRQQKSLVSQA
jgi:hypothetical protein